MKIKSKKSNRKNPKVNIEYLKDLVGKKVTLLVNNGYVIEILEYRYSKYRLSHVVGKEAIFSFTFEENDVKSLEFEEGGNYYIDIRTN